MASAAAERPQLVQIVPAFPVARAACGLWRHAAPSARRGGAGGAAVRVYTVSPASHHVPYSPLPLLRLYFKIKFRIVTAAKRRHAVNRTSTLVFREQSRRSLSKSQTKRVATR